MFEYAKTLGGEPYLYYSKMALHYKLEISRNKEKSRDMDTLVHKTIYYIKLEGSRKVKTSLVLI